jgi:hypothetical protein
MAGTLHKELELIEGSGAGIMGATVTYYWLVSTGTGVHTCVSSSHVSRMKLLDVEGRSPRHCST